MKLFWTDFNILFCLKVLFIRIRRQYSRLERTRECNKGLYSRYYINIVPSESENVENSVIDTERRILEVSF